MPISFRRVCTLAHDCHTPFCLPQQSWDISVSILRDNGLELSPSARLRYSNLKQTPMLSDTALFGNFLLIAGILDQVVLESNNLLRDYLGKLAINRVILRPRTMLCCMSPRQATSQARKLTHQKTRPRVASQRKARDWWPNL